MLLLSNFLLLELVDDPRWGAVGSTLLSAVALIVAISDPEAGQGLRPRHWVLVRPRHWVLVAVCVAIARLVLIVNSSSISSTTASSP